MADEDGEGMSNVLVSLSGKQYRNNNLTKDDGSFLFSNLVSFVSFTQLATIADILNYEVPKP